MQRYNPSYGYTDNFRLLVCLSALKHGKTKACSIHGVSYSSVNNWLKVYSLVEAT